MRFALVLLFTFLLAGSAVQAVEKTRVLYVGGDWKAQLPNFQGKTPLRGHFVKQEVEKAAPERFEFSLWTSYEFLQYGDSETLKNFDVLVVGDVMGQSVLPRLVRGVTEFVEDGGGLWYCDNHKAFMFYENERSFEAMLPIEILPFRAYGPDDNQPRCGEGAVKPVIAAANHPTVKGLDWASAPAIRGGDKWGPGYGKVKDGATVLARSPGGKDIWVGWEKGKGRTLWTGGVFANDELSEDFATWPQFGQFAAQVLTWLAEKSTYPRAALKDAVAEGTLTVDTAKKGPVATAKHFGIHGQEDCPGGSYPMKDADLALYQALKLDGGFARTSSFMGIKKLKDNQSEDDGTDLTTFDPAKYDWKNADVVVKDLERIKVAPVFLYWCPWWGPNWPDPARYTKYFAASIEHVNGKSGTPEYKPRLEYFEIMNEPHIGPAPDVLNRYTAFFNHAVEKLRPRYPGVKFGCGGFNEWTYVQAIIDQCGKNLDWFSRHPYGHTGEAVFFLQDRQAVDYGYDATKAINTYKQWKNDLKPVAIQGWGTADTEALIDLVSKDAVVFMSGSSSGHLTDPTGRSPWTSTPAPYNFFYGPSYSDGCRALVQFAAEQWKRTGTAQRGSTFLGDLYRPKFAYLGDNHPFPNSPRAACIEYARDLGFDIAPPIRYSLTPSDYTAQCETLKQTGAQFAFLANTAESNVALLKACAKLGVATQFLTNIYGWDEEAGRQAGDAGNGLVWVVSVARWGDDVAGMETVRKVSKQSDPSGADYRPVHYIRGVCSAFLMRDAMEAAAKMGEVSGANIKKAFEEMRDHVPQGLEGVCLPTTLTPTDHRGTTTVMLYRNDYNFGTVTQTRVYTTTIPLRPDWLGW